MRKLLRSVFLCLWLIFTLAPLGAKASPGISSASLSLAPATGTFTVGSTFTVSLFLNTGGQAVNAIEANLNFPTDKLQVVAPSAGKSLIHVWINQPTYSNIDGSLKFQGAIPNPGINTESGLISTVTFRVKQVGVATVKISDSSRVLLNDGKGTDILGNTDSGVYELILPPPAGPLVVSPTHPDQTKWYPINNAALGFEKIPAVRGFSYVLNDSPVDVPDEISEGIKTNVVYTNLADGIHYFHIKSLGADAWGGVTHFAVNVDKTPPATFPVNISPSNYTSRRQPIIDFRTTDAASGIDHYELKIIPLDGSAREALGVQDKNGTPFFIEVNPPYYRELGLGRYDVVVRGYDKAGNFYQATEKLTITRAVFELVRGEGIQIKGVILIRWPYVWALCILLLIILGYLGRRVLRRHREVHEYLESGALRHPTVAPKLEELRKKQKDYSSDSGKGLAAVVMLILMAGAMVLGSKEARAQVKAASVLKVEPPIVTLLPKAISNDEILYIGGRAGAPEAEVIVYLQNKTTGESISQSVKTDQTGAWFYSFSQFFNPGDYVVWTQLKVGDELSPPSPERSLVVAPLAIQIGGGRLGYEELYLIILSVLSAAFLGIIIFIGYHSYHQRVKSKRLLEEIRQAEESVRRGFLVLRRDIEAELATIRRAKMSKELQFEEKTREEKLLKDLELVNNYVGKEIWEIEKELGS
ncbi:MAG: hypothetical protein HY093_00570 [Candidatus Liptonbacteria bacterium]|nr:hypothetical protein [Candidatus Liptonbacteria bacterium]